MYITPGGKLVHCFLPHFLEGTSGKKVVLAIKSNNPNTPPVILLDSILDHVLILAKKSLALTNTVWDPIPLDLTNTNLMTLLPTKGDWADCYIG